MVNSSAFTYLTIRFCRESEKTIHRSKLEVMVLSSDSVIVPLSSTVFTLTTTSGPGVNGILVVRSVAPVL